ncbi:hypothetical protein Tco_1503811 [Tanacetum coccineum]
MGPPPATPGSEKTVSFQKSILGHGPKHIIINNAKVPVASGNEIKQFYKPLSKPEVGFSKPNFRSKTSPPRRVNNNYSRPKTLQPKRHVCRQNQPHGFPICLGVDLEPDEWIKDSGCSKHMTGNRKLFSTYKAYNGVEESLNVTFDETPPPSKTSPLVDDDLDEEEAIKVTEKKNLENDIVDETLEIDEIVNIKESRNHPLENVIGNLNQRTLRFNLAYYMAKRMKWVTKQARLILPYGMLLTRLFTFIMNEYPELNNESYVLYDRVMTPLATQLERKPRRDRGMRRGRHSTSSSFAFDQPSSSHLNDYDDDGNDEETSRASTHSPIGFVNSLTNQVPQVFQNPPNIDPHLEPFYTCQTEIINRQVQLRDEHRGGRKSIEKV